VEPTTRIFFIAKGKVLFSAAKLLNAVQTANKINEIFFDFLLAIQFFAVSSQQENLLTI
jgi:hypothetical protein